MELFRTFGITGKGIEKFSERSKIRSKINSVQIFDTNVKEMYANTQRINIKSFDKNTYTKNAIIQSSKCFGIIRVASQNPQNERPMEMKRFSLYTLYLSSKLNDEIGMMYVVLSRLRLRCKMTNVCMAALSA